MNEGGRCQRHRSCTDPGDHVALAWRGRRGDPPLRGPAAVNHLQNASNSVPSARHGLVPQPEVLTRSIAWLGSCAGNWRDECACRSWRARASRRSIQGHGGPRRLRRATDLECSWGDPPFPHVVVKAKVGAALTAEQIDAYISELSRGLGPGDHDALMVILLLENRRGEASQVLDARNRCAASRSVPGSRDTRACTNETMGSVLICIQGQSTISATRTCPSPVGVSYRRTAPSSALPRTSPSGL
jgi:hypothetical protein